MNDEAYIKISMTTFNGARAAEAFLINPGSEDVWYSRRVVGDGADPIECMYEAARELFEHLPKLLAQD